MSHLPANMQHDHQYAQLPNGRLHPIIESANLICEAIEKNNVIIITSPTGSGKTM